MPNSESTCDKRSDHSGHCVFGIKDENGRCNSRPEKTMNDSPSVRQIERGSYAPHYRKSSAWIFLSADDSKSSASSFPSGGRPEVSVDVGLSLFTGGEAARDNTGSGDELPQRVFIGIGNHEYSEGPSVRRASITAYCAIDESTSSVMTSPLVHSWPPNTACTEF